ncbi:hypothetical protein M0813_22324 [Anaeramoeba flamelloides]|uniref:Uncharacterized protein n=1 Tax=Anaeramoeba flamelloides TaxID=1746091 RepID=A0ABQ8YF07_9EUKA|nr:hypothetical protein M0813_22324 [Anaeramoeba flamelloides]
MFKFLACVLTFLLVSQSFEKETNPNLFTTNQPRISIPSTLPSTTTSAAPTPSTQTVSTITVDYSGEEGCGNAEQKTYTDKECTIYTEGSLAIIYTAINETDYTQVIFPDNECQSVPTSTKNFKKGECSYNEDMDVYLKATYTISSNDDDDGDKTSSATVLFSAFCFVFSLVILILNL